MEAGRHPPVGEAAGLGGRPGHLLSPRSFYLPGSSAAAAAAQGCSECSSSASSSGSLSVIPAWLTSSSTLSGFPVAGQPPARQPPAPGGRTYPRVYEVWPQVGGRNRFLCCGQCITGPHIDFWFNSCAWFFIVVPTVLYFVVVAPYLQQNVHFLLPVLTCLVFVLTVILFLLTSCTDPGIIPRPALQVAAGLQEEVATVTRIPPSLFDTATYGPVYTLTPQQQAMGYKWCRWCQLVIPPRAHHCSDCGNCVLTYDHHCPFVNNCVGQRNYTFFIGFIISTLCLGVAVGTGWYMYATETTSGSDTPFWLLLLLAMIGLPAGALLLGVLALGLLHVYLAVIGRTTREICRGRVGASTRTLFAFRGPSLIHARSRVHFPMAAA